MLPWGLEVVEGLYHVACSFLESMSGEVREDCAAHVFILRSARTRKRSGQALKYPYRYLENSFAVLPGFEGVQTAQWVLRVRTKLHNGS